MTYPQGYCIKLAWFDGPTPLLTDLETELHFLPVCPECEAVQFGNMFCDTCRSEGKKYLNIKLGKLCEGTGEDKNA